MSKHAADTASATKKLLSAGLVFGGASLGLFAGSATAGADGHNVTNPDGTFGATDAASPSQRLGYDQEYGVDLVPAVFSYVTSSYPAGGSYGPNMSTIRSNPYVPTSSYPLDPSWPGGGWGVDEHG